MELDMMEMPCPCDGCGGWFDLNDGKRSEKFKNLICHKCADAEEIESEIEDCEEEIVNHESDLNYERKRLETLKNRLTELNKTEA